MGVGKPSNSGVVLLDGYPIDPEVMCMARWMHGYEDRWRVHGLSLGYEVLYRGEDVYSGSMAPDRLYSKLVNGGHTCS